MEELISVVVPIYNVEKYLQKCIDSILAQTYRHLEIILVDDGSPDNCGAICDNYAQEDGRVLVIHKKNGGLSSARNAGLEIAKGELIVFIDSDDWIDANYIEKLYDDISEVQKHARNAFLDVVTCKYLPAVRKAEIALFCFNFSAYRFIYIKYKSKKKIA